jgi:apolipoprotein N-acyltransferase
VGLATSALFTRKHPPKKSSLLFALVSCLGGNFLLFWPLSWLGPFVLILISFLAGVFLGWVGFASFFLIPCFLFLVKLKQPWQNQDPTPLEKGKMREFLPLFCHICASYLS